jgi:hypothetical protein
MTRQARQAAHRIALHTNRPPRAAEEMIRR